MDKKIETTNWNVIKFTSNELGLINLVIQTTQDREWKVIPRTYLLSEMDSSLSIFEKINKFVEWDNYVDWEIEFWTEEKALIIKYIKERKWVLADWKSVKELQDKLK